MKEHGRKHSRVLVVDDDISILILFQRVLSRVETDRTVHLEIGESESKLFKENASSQSLQLFDVVTCQQGGEAVDAIKSSIKENRPFSVAFIDIRMPPGPAAHQSGTGRQAEHLVGPAPTGFLTRKTAARRHGIVEPIAKRVFVTAGKSAEPNCPAATRGHRAAIAGRR